MPWNYRMTVTRVTGTDYDVYAIREIYYGDNDKIGWTDPVTLSGGSPHDVLDDLELIALVRERKILNLDTREEIDWPEQDDGPDLQ